VAFVYMANAFTCKVRVKGWWTTYIYIYALVIQDLLLTFPSEHISYFTRICKFQNKEKKIMGSSCKTAYAQVLEIQRLA